MTLHEQLVAARKKKGLTQEELAEQSKVTVRTIQRIESGETTPRAFTLRAIAVELDVPFETLQAASETVPEEDKEQPALSAPVNADAMHFLQMLCLSCFSFLLIPFIHFLLPAFLLRKRKGLPWEIVLQGRQLVRGQVLWVVGLIILMLVTVGFNLYRKSGGLVTVSYLLPAAAAYGWNLVSLLFYYFRLHQRLSQTLT